MPVKTKMLNFLITLVLIAFSSCAGKKGTGEGASKDAQGTESMSAEQVGSESEMGKSGSMTGTGAALEGLERIYFDFDDANLREDAREVLKRDAEIIKQNPGKTVQLEGHCDERGSGEYNLALGERRAESIKKYLATLGVSNQKMSTISYGEEKPIVEGHSEDAWSKNRRGEILAK